MGEGERALAASEPLNASIDGRPLDQARSPLHRAFGGERRMQAEADAGGDEFAVVLPDVPEHAAYDAAKRIEAAFVKPLELGAPLRAAVGVACHPRDGDGPDELLAAADRAMYARKAAS